MISSIRLKPSALKLSAFSVFVYFKSCILSGSGRWTGVGCKTDFKSGLGCQNHLFYKVFVVSMLRFELAIFDVIL